MGNNKIRAEKRVVRKRDHKKVHCGENDRESVSSR